jgi:hypothetical protein
VDVSPAKNIWCFGGMSSDLFSLRQPHQMSSSDLRSHTTTHHIIMLDDDAAQQQSSLERERENKALPEGGVSDSADGRFDSRFIFCFRGKS